MQNRIASLSTMGDIVRVVAQNKLFGHPTRIRSISTVTNSRRRFCTSTNALMVVDSLTLVDTPPSTLGNTFLSHSQRRIGLKKDPASDKYGKIRSATKAARAAYIPAHPVPSKARSDPDDRDATLICPGCGVYMQDTDPMKPGYFRVPVKLEHKPDKQDGLTLEELQELQKTYPTQQEEDATESEKKKEADSSYSYFEIVNGEMTKLDTREFQPPSDYHRNDIKALEDTWGDIVEGAEEVEERKRQRNLLKSFKREKPVEERVVVCARCHSLKFYGRVKEKTAEELLPTFDFEKMVAQRLKTAYGKRAVVLMVVDAADFDGSFPRQVAKLISEVEEQMAATYKTGTSGNSPRLIVAATKVDLLPGQLSPTRLEQWIRKRVIIGGAPRPIAVHLISATKNWGIQALTERIMKVAGPRGEVWVVGAQNAGKSSLINALARFNVGKHENRLTEAAHPGTTIGILKITGILPQGIKLFDTPGIMHAHQLTNRLNEEEFKSVQLRKELKPRTYRIKVGHSIQVGGFLRLDLLESPNDRTIYMTVWASPFISLHMGKTEKAVDNFKNHIGVALKPPMSLKSWLEHGQFTSQKIRVRGDDWEASSVDISVAGLGWVGLGLKGEALIEVWTFEGVGVSTREALVYDYARDFEKTGFTVVHQTEKPNKKRPSNAETSYNRKADRLAKEKLKAGAKPKQLAEPLTEQAEGEGEPLELW